MKYIEDNNYRNLNDYLLEFLDLHDVYELLAKAAIEIGTGLGFRYGSMTKTIVYSDSEDFRGNIKSFPFKEIIRLYKTQTVYDGERICGYIFFEKIPNEEKNVVLEALFIALRFFSRREKKDEINKTVFLSRFFEDLVTNRQISDEEVRKRGNILGVPLDESFVCLLLTGLVSDLQMLTLTRLKAFFAKVFFIPLKKISICLLYVRNKDFEKIKEDILHTFHIVSNEYQDYEKSSDISSCFWGVSELRDSLFLLPESFFEAKNAHIYALLNKKREPVFWREIGTFGLICTMADSETARFLIDSRLSRILEHDEKHNTNLFETLSILEEENWNLASTAKKLFFHYNTVKYRYYKINKILESDLQDNGVRFEISLALKLYSVNAMLPKYKI